MRRLLLSIFGLLLFAGVCFGQSREARQIFLNPVLGQSIPVPKPAPSPSPSPVAASSPAPVVVPMDAEFDPHLSLGGGLSSGYIRDGWCENSSPVLGMQAEFMEGGMYVGIRSTYDFSGKAGRRRHFQDSRLYLGYSMPFRETGSLGPVSVDICWTYNTYPGHSEENSGSLSVGLNLEEIWRSGRFVVTGGVTLEHNYGKNETFVATEAACHLSLAEEGALQWENALVLFWGDSDRMRRMTASENAGNALYTLMWRSALPWDLGHGWSVTPYAEILFHPDRRARDAAREDAFNSAATALAGVRISYFY